MKKVAVFGNTGGGKSTVAKTLADITGLPLVTLDKIMYQSGGDVVPHDEYLAIHADILKQEAWIIDGFGCAPSAWDRFSVADTLVYVDLPLFTHFWWVTKRFMKGLFVNPEGWPERSPIFKSTVASYQVLWLCHRKLTPRYRMYAAKSADSKQVIHLKTPHAIHDFLVELRKM